MTIAAAGVAAAAALAAAGVFEALRLYRAGFEAHAGLRAYAKTARLAAPLVEPGGRLLALKGPKLDEVEWQEATVQAATCQCRSPEKWKYSLPLTSERRLLVSWKKLSETFSG